jgi:hypothetical protein
VKAHKVARRVTQAKLRGRRLMKVQPAELDLERLKPHLKASVFEDAARRWQSAAKLNSASDEFREKISLAIIHLLIGSIAANHPVRLHDKSEIKRSLGREHKAVRRLASACRLYGTGWGCAPREQERALFVSICRVAALDNAMDQLKKLREGRAKYQAFEKFVCLVKKAYESASDDPPVVKIDYARGVDEQCSGPFAELLEVVRGDADKIWKMASFKINLNGPHDRNARLEYARKVAITLRRAERRSG